MKIVSVIKGLAAAAKANPHVCLAGAAVIGVAGVAVSAYAAGKKACTMLEAERLAKGAELNRKEKAKIIFKCAWITALLAVMTGGAIIGSTYIANKHIKKLAVAYSTTAGLLEAHQQAELAKLGADVAKEIKEEVGEKCDLPEPTKLNTCHSHAKGVNDYLCYDDFSGRYFYSNADKIEAAFIKTSRLLFESFNNSVVLNDLYNFLDMEEAGCGMAWGWDLEFDNENIREYIHYELYPSQAPGGEPCLILTYHPLQVVPF